MELESGTQVCNLCYKGLPVVEFQNLLDGVCRVCGPCLLAAIKVWVGRNPAPFHEVDTVEDTPLAKIEQSIIEISGQWKDGFFRGLRDNMSDRPSRILKLYGLSDVGQGDDVGMDQMKVVLRYIPLDQQAWIEGYNTGYYDKNIEYSTFRWRDVPRVLLKELFFPEDNG